MTVKEAVKHFRSIYPDIDSWPDLVVKILTEYYQITGVFRLIFIHTDILIYFNDELIINQKIGYRCIIGDVVFSELDRFVLKQKLLLYKTII